MWMHSSLPSRATRSAWIAAGRRVRASVDQRRSADGMSSVEPASSERVKTKSNTVRTSQSIR